MEHEINILVVEPGRPPRPARVDYSLETFSQLVGGELAMGCFLPHRVMLLYNEDANRQGLPPNRCNPFVNECISGTFLLCGLSDEEGLPDCTGWKRQNCLAGQKSSAMSAVWRACRRNLPR